MLLLLKVTIIFQIFFIDCLNDFTSSDRVSFKSFANLLPETSTKRKVFFIVAGKFLGNPE